MLRSKVEFFVHLKFMVTKQLIEKRYLLLLFLLCFASSFIFCINEFPAGSDIPAHYIKIMNMQNMLEEGKFIRWSEDWYNGYAMFDVYPPLLYIFAAILNMGINNTSIVMKLFIIVSFSMQPILLYRLGKALGRSLKGATVMAILFSLTPLNVFFLFNGYFLLIISLTLTLMFLIEFCKYSQNQDNKSFLTSTAVLALISLSYHRALYFILFILFFYTLIKAYRKQLREVASTIFMAGVGVGLSSFWLLPAIVDMLTFQSVELYQSLVIVATYNGISFQMIAILFIVPYIYLVLKRMRTVRIRDDRELALLFTLIFFTILALGPFGLLYYVIPFASSQRVEITLLIVTFLATILSSSLFNERIIEGRRTFSGIVLSSLITLILIISVFFYPQPIQSLEAINFTYAKDGLNDSLTNLVSNAYIEQQVFLGKSDEAFISALQYISHDQREGRVAFYSNRSQTVDMFYYYAMLPASGKSTPQGIAPEGEVDLKWNVYTQYIIWHVNETLLELSGTRWIISNYPLVFRSDSQYQRFGQYWVYELDDVKMIQGCDGHISKDVGEINIVLDRKCQNLIVAESYHPRWYAFDQNQNRIQIESTKFGFMNITSSNTIKELSLIYSDTMEDVIGRITSVVCMFCYFFMILVGHPFQRARRHKLSSTLFSHLLKRSRTNSHRLKETY